MTCHRRTGATSALCGIRSEKSRILADDLQKKFTDAQRGQVLHVASDAPSAELFQTLKEVLPNLQEFIAGCHAYCYGLRPKHEQPPDRGKQMACCHHEQISQEALFSHAGILW